MSQETEQVVTETVSESPTTEATQDSSNEQYIAESKKYRKRAQEAEAQLNEMKSRFEKQEEEKLKEKEDFKALYEKVSSENEGLLSKATKQDEYESKRRASLLSKHPEEDQDNLKKLDIETLEYVTSKINNIKPNAPEAPGHARKQELEKSFSDMSEKEKRENWGKILKQYSPGN